MATTPLSPNSYDVGDGIHTTVTFKTTVAGVRTLTDPSTVTFKTRSPAGAVTTLTYGVDAALVKDAVGSYHCDFNATAAGTWYYRWAGTGLAAGASEVQLQVKPSEF